MSHYSVCVTVPHHYDGTQVDAEVIESCLDKILAPFDEQTVFGKIEIEQKGAKM